MYTFRKANDQQENKQKRDNILNISRKMIMINLLMRISSNNFSELIRYTIENLINISTATR
jgi:hypothetical protein